jgi:ABC-2 type transport system ATP-binding protein
LAQLSGLWGHAKHVRVEGLLERVNLKEVAERAVGTYSKGMLQRLAIAQALVSDPDLLILDEPTSGLDPRSQWEVRQIIMALCNQGKTILLCSHYLAEVEVLCNTVGMLRRGQLILCGAVADLLHSQNIVEILLAPDLSAQDVVSRLGIAVIEMQGNLLRIAASSQSAVLSALVRAHIPILALNPMYQTLEEVYVRANQ